MELPPALFLDMTGLPASNANPHPDETPLTNWVFLGQKTVLVRDLAGGEVDAAAAMIRRVSVQGVGLLLDRELPAGEAFTLLLPRRGDQPVAVRCAAVRCEVGSDGLYRVGAVYTAVLGREYARTIRGLTIAA